MKEYPKVPRYDHPVVEEEWFGDGTVVVEKYDGSNFRFALYDEFYEQYSQVEHAEFGDFIVGSSSVYRSESHVDEFPNNLKMSSRLEYIKNRVDTTKLRQLHEKYESPIIVFGENMIRHTIEYNWDEVDPLIIFDIYVPGLDTDQQVDFLPYEETFSGFLDWKTVNDITADVLNMKLPRKITSDVTLNQLSDMNIGTSEYADETAEGWVIRNDHEQRRIKYRSQKYKELHSKIWRETDESDPIEKQIIYEYATEARVRKLLKKAVNEHNYNISTELLNHLAIQVTEDIWNEEIEQFYNNQFTPYELYKNAADCIKYALMRPNLFGFPEQAETIAKQWNQYNLPEPTHPSNPNKFILQAVNNTFLTTTTEQIVENSEKEFGNWVIQPLTDAAKGYIWYDQKHRVLSINNEIDGYKINQNLYDITVPFVKNY